MRQISLVAVGLLLSLATGIRAEKVYESPQGGLKPDHNGLLEVQIDDLPPHTLLQLSLDVGIRVPGEPANSWITSTTESSEVLEISTSERILLESSFSDAFFGQSFPDAFGNFIYMPRMGAIDSGVVGLRTRYKFDLVLPHDGDSLDLSFEWLRKFRKAPAAGIGDTKRFGDFNLPFEIRQLTVSTIPQAELDRSEVVDLLDTIGAHDPVAAQKALQLLIAGGDDTFQFVRSRFDLSKVDPGFTPAFETLIGRLQSDSFAERANAEAELSLMGRAALPHIREKLSGGGDELPFGVSFSLQCIEAATTERVRKSNQILANRLRAALAPLGSEVTQQLLRDLPPMKKLTFYKIPAGSRRPAMPRAKVRVIRHKFEFEDLPSIDEIDSEPEFPDEDEFLESLDELPPFDDIEIDPFKK